MTSPLVPVSWGELLDKIVILEIKCLRLRAPAARDNAATELALLQRAASGATGASIFHSLPLVDASRLASRSPMRSGSPL